MDRMQERSSNTDTMLVLSASHEGQIADPARPVIAAAADVSEAHVIPAHRHPRAQLLYAVRGEMGVGVDGAVWFVGPGQAVWVPPGTAHRVMARGPVAYRSAYVDPVSMRGWPCAIGPVEIPPLVRELLVEAAAFGAQYGAQGAERRLIGVLADRLRSLQRAPLALPLPSDSRVRCVAEALILDAADDRTLAQWGEIAGATPRTLARLFRRETGLSFAAWRMRLRLARAIDLLLKGESVSRIALDLGYASPSAFTVMFRRSLGASPVRYLRRCR